ncbi:SDR family oxidoreductase [Rhodococcoides fascians]|uniref:SDR family oxidoreductase n=1 Tax=Rhodococcoides fascians TaxID=1828 RepID=UPI002ACE9341|nr:SDR family oxidoreductase [Rhodococcus fascians]WQH28826.1 SDR family oxidoreductase [Rhodococcus fascians]
METSLAGKVAVVTGSTAGIGRGIANRLAAEGARVVVVGRREELVRESAGALTATYGDEASYGVAADVTKPEDLQRLVDEVLAECGSIDILVNNAGQPAHVPFLANDDNDWHYDIELKLMAAVRLARLVIPHMASNGGGRILNILSFGAKVQPANTSPTSITRAAGMALTKLLSKEFAKDNILVNALLLGMAKSTQWERRWESEGRPGTLDEFYASLSETIPLGRPAEPDEIGDFAAFLVGPRATYLTGAAINFDGGTSPVV